MSVNTKETAETVDQDAVETEVENSDEERAPEETAAPAEPQADAPPDTAGTEAEASGESAVGGDEEAESPPAEADGAPTGPDEGRPVQRAEFQPLPPKGGAVPGDNMQLLMDVTVPVTIELGSTKMSLRDVLELGPGSVVKLDRPLGDPVDILVNGERVGRGEVVVVDDQFGLRVTELLRPNAKAKA